MNEFKIFFSWQSDLSSNKTTRFIDECLTEVESILQNIVSIKPDRATEGLTGSPDITESIFSKIDDADLFIADLSIVNKFIVQDENTEENRKFTPNPNVLLETGYAARALSWDRVICLFNQQYGNPNDFPFDIDHRRMTPYQFTQSTREDEKKRIVKIIADTVLQLIVAGGVKRRGKAYFEVGGYDFTRHIVTKTVSPYRLRESKYYQESTKKILEECRLLYDEIKKIELPIEKNLIEETENLVDMEHSLANIDWGGITTKKKFVDDEKTFIKKSVQKYLSETTGDDFFDLGNLQVKVSLINKHTEYIGSDDEKRKLDLIEKLDSNLLELDLLNIYVETFDDIIIIPLAIYNSSNELDKNVTVNIRIKDNITESVFPEKNLFNPEYQSEDDKIGLEGFVYDKGYIESLLKMDEDGYICYASEAFYREFDPSRIKTPIFTGAGFETPRSDAMDYEAEIQTYVKMPIDKSQYQCTVKSIRPNEIMWLGEVLMLKATEEKVVLQYTIISENTNGDLTGEIEINN